RVAVGVGDGHDRVVERRLDVGHAPADVAALLAFLALGHVSIAPQARFCEPPLSLPTHLLDALLAGDGLARPLPGPGVGPRPRAAHGQAAAVPQPAVALDGAQPGDVLLHLPAQRALHRVLAVQDRGQAADLVVAQVAGAPLRIDLGLVAQLHRRGRPD